MVTIVITSYIASVIFAIALQIVLFRTGHLRRREYDTDAGIGLMIIGNAVIWPLMLTVLGLGRITHE